PRPSRRSRQVDNFAMAAPGFTLAPRLRAGETVFSGWCALPAPIVAEVIARGGFSAVNIDQQHGMWDTAATAAGIAAIRQAGAAPIVRIPLGQFAAASRALDFVAAAKYPPLGERSWGPNRATMLAGIADQKVYLREANDLTVTMAMVETVT